MVTAPELYSLQETDQALDKAKGRLAEIQGQLGESEEMIQAREAADAQREGVDALRSRISDAEDAVEDVGTKASEVEKKLYGGTVTSPKELSDLNDDLNSLKHQVSIREDTLLGLLVEKEEADARLAEAESEYARIESGWKREQDTLLREKGRLEPEIASLQARRDAQSPSVDRSSLRLYEILRERHRGYAVARVERGMCQGCRITLPMSLLQKVRSGIGLVQCVSCERILLLSQ
jgi:predicted  nucleic acid-binding Zn-ribbon protein